jgi:4-hydroxybenzoate polyprenyltransferase
MKPQRKITYLQTLQGFIRLIRWQNLAIIVLTQYFTRFFLIRDKPLSFSHLLEIILNKNIFLISLSTVLIAASGYIINDYYDIKIDLVNKPDRVVIGRYIKRRWALAIHQVFNGLGILLGLFISKKVALVNLTAVFCLWLYANQLKRLAFWGNFMVAILTGFSLLILAVYYPGHQREVWVYAIFSFFITLIREIIKDMEDVKGDEKHGCRTLPIIWGIARTKILVYVLIASFISTLFILTTQLPNQRIAYIFFVMMLPVGFLTYKLVYADKPKDFAFLSDACKIIMLIGVLTMMFV